MQEQNTLNKDRAVQAIQSLPDYQSLEPSSRGTRATAAPGVLPHIFITGRAGHGKDSIGDHLIACYGFGKLSFSDGIRDEIAIAYAKAPLAVTSQWQDTRDIKNSPQARLALTHCRDQDFVACALTAFEQEDAELFVKTKQAFKRGLPLDDSQTLDPARTSILDDSMLTPDSDSFSPGVRTLLPRSPRRIQQVWGTEYRRSQDDNYWLKYAEKNCDFGAPKVLTSVRYQNELEFGERINAVRIHVQRQDHNEAAAHISEHILPFDAKTIVIDNVGTLDDLRKKVDICIAQMATGASIDQDGQLVKRQRPAL